MVDGLFGFVVTLATIGVACGLSYAWSLIGLRMDQFFDENSFVNGFVRPLVVWPPCIVVPAIVLASWPSESKHSFMWGWLIAMLVVIVAGFGISAFSFIRSRKNAI